MWDGEREAIALLGSPFTFTNLAAAPVVVFVSGGTGMGIEFSRSGTTWDPVGQPGGQFRLNPGDMLRVTYLLAPTLVQYPL